MSRTTRKRTQAQLSIYNYEGLPRHSSNHNRNNNTSSSGSSTTSISSADSNSNSSVDEFDTTIPRSGKWTTEEENFAKRLIMEFESGLLRDCEEGCTLRAYLARRLNCAPMRISKKFAGKCIGKVIVFKIPYLNYK